MAFARALAKGPAWLRPLPLLVIWTAKNCLVILDGIKLHSFWLSTIASNTRRVRLEILPVTVFVAPSRGGAKRLGQFTAMQRQDTGLTTTYVGSTDMMRTIQSR
ncbi:hypothetical protein F4820DRAFT_417097 [Hypoxylon rubiginosum]|uniref:Uncharacterized protein n=1 Tax=Hypoxylon rubiginosum TaxID=110542 RepID=A0ACB9Z5J2_9PEZI|nr:hypothetical protein F4820DRAFT_417097 [Hypoxylon rubiginosum]